MAEAGLVERLEGAPPRASIADVLSDAGISRPIVFGALATSMGAVGGAAGSIAFLAAIEIGTVTQNQDRSGVFVDGTGAFWACVGGVIALAGAFAAGIAYASFDSQAIRRKLVEYRRAVEAWRAGVQRRIDTAISALREIKTRNEERDNAFEVGFIAGRQWVADSFADLAAERDSVREFVLRNKPHPGISSAAVVRESKAEKRLLAAENRLLKMQLASYEEYFPELVDYRELVLDEAREFVLAEGLAEVDPVLRFLTQDEYRGLSNAERNQLALDRYKRKSKSDWEIGRLYERKIGYAYEKDGWRVTFEGAIKGLADFGRDLIVHRNGEYRVIQCKNWSSSKLIREKHIFQLFGTTVMFRITNGLAAPQVRAVFCTTTQLSPEALAVADELGVQVERTPMSDFPMIKCNVTADGQRIYHLPFDQMYDKVVIGNRTGESYVPSVVEAEQLGFRRAYRWRPDGPK